MSEEDRNKIVNLMKATTPKKPRARKAPVTPQPPNVMNITGSGNMVAGRDIHIHNTASKEPPHPPVQPGVTHISAAQRKVLRQLVEDIGETEARLRQSPKAYGAVYAALFKQFARVDKLEQIPLESFEAARGYLNQWLGRLNSMPSAPVKNVDDWRKRRYAYIKVNTKEPADADALVTYIKRYFDAESISELANDELERTYRYVAGRRSRRR